MGKFGAPADLILNVTSEAVAAESQDVEILDANWDAVQAWLRCQPTVVGSMAGAVTVGITTTEVREVCSVLGIALDEVMLDKIQHLARVADRIRNR